MPRLQGRDLTRGKEDMRRGIEMITGGSDLGLKRSRETPTKRGGFETSNRQKGDTRAIREKTERGGKRRKVDRAKDF